MNVVKNCMSKKEFYLQPNAEIIQMSSCLCIMDSFSGEGYIDQFEPGDELDWLLDDADGYDFNGDKVY